MMITLLLMKSNSSPSSVFQERTWPPCKLTVAEAPRWFRRMSRDIPFLSLVNSIPTVAVLLSLSAAPTPPPPPEVVFIFNSRNGVVSVCDLSVSYGNKK